MAETLSHLALSIVARSVDKNGVDPDHLNFNTTNATLIGMQRRYCTLTNGCPIQWATIKYRPSVAGNTIYLLCFLVIFFAQLWYGIRKKTWTYMGALLLGSFTEFMGYIGRIMLNKNPFLMNNFLMNLIPLTIAPAFITAGIYLCLGRVITAIGSENSRLKPKMYTYVFVGFDLLSLILQAIGGGIAATAKDQKGSKSGADIMIGGLICQVISMVLFFVVWGDFALRVRRNKLNGALARTQPPLYNNLRSTRLFHYFQWSLFIATILVFIRCIYRVAELWEGFSSHLANDEATFMIFEGPFIIGALALMTVFHPGRVFGDLWIPAGKGVRSSGSKLGDSDSTSSTTDLNEWKTDNSAYTRV